MSRGASDLVAAAAFMEQYDDVLGDHNALDYSALIATAVALLQDPQSGLRDQLRRRFRHVFVDEYQDTDPSQVALLRELAAPDAELVAVGDPHQSIYGFRGADVRGILRFPDAFRHTGGEPADVVVLRTTRRFGPVLLESARSVAQRLPLPGAIPGEQQAAFRSPLVDEAADPGRVEVMTFDTDRAEAEHLADLLRRAHLEDGVAWSDMAVLVRSGRSTIPPLRRALVAAGVPIEVTADELPLSREPAVLPVLDALHAVAEPEFLDTDRAEALLLSPLGGLDPTDVRAVARELRHRARAAGETPVPSPELVRAALAEPVRVEGIEASGADRIRALATLLAGGRDLLDKGGSVEELLWHLWDGTGWPARLRASAEGAGGAGAARLAHRDLDAICALFDYAARVEDRVGHTGVLTFLETLRAQEIPSDSLADRGARGDAVRLLTAHRSKGLEWRLVVVAHVQEGAWPDLRLRSGLLGVEEIGHEGLVPRPSMRELLAEERRLFYVACTRARERLVVTAVASADDDGEEPSRFLTELGLGYEPEDVHHVGRPRRPLSMAGLVAELRRTCSDPAAPPVLREAAARRLRRLPLPAADPAHWWGTRAASRAGSPVRPADEPLRVTASMLSALESCPARWFLEREAGGGQAASQAQGFGNVVHALADRVGRGEVEADVDALMEHVDAVWEQIPFRTPWSAAREREEARGALARFVAWHERAARTPLDYEQRFDAKVELGDGTEVRIHGYADRLELDDQGRIVVVDLKTTKYPPADKDLPEDPQLGLYQLAVEQGAFDRLAPDGRGVPGGAELWQLRKSVRGGLKVQRQDPLEQADPGDDERPIERRLRQAVEMVRSERFPALPDKSKCERCDFRAQCPAWNSEGVIS